MFELNLIKAINDYKINPDTENKVYLLNLIKNNKEEINKFINNPNIEPNFKQIIYELLNESNSYNNNSNNPNNIDEKIISLFNQWKEAYNKNNIEKQNQIAKNLANYLFENDLNKLIKLFEIKEDLYYEKFKNSLQNNLRILVSEKIENFLDNQYKNLNLIEKFKARRFIKKIIKEISVYDFKIESLENLKKVIYQNG